jgi:NAD(P)-dependent dehydrogenase (short-subunit alcohol dehydrogenase family)
MQNGRRLEGKVAVVTGASAGVGRAIVRALAHEGARVGLIARTREALEVAAEEVRSAGSEALVLPLDVSDADAVFAAAERVVAEWGQLDLWVNDAMVSVFAPVVETTPAEFRRVTEVNYLGYVHGTLAALRHMRPRNAGTIIQIGSTLAYRSIPLQSAYCASKSAARGFTDSLRSELYRERSKIRLSMVHLPAVNTPQFEVVRSRLPGHPQPVPPVYQPEVAARAVVHTALHPRREVWVGANTIKAIIGQRFIPGLLDRYLARVAWEGQTTRELPPGHPSEHPEDNVDAPLAGDRGAHGPFDHIARTSSKTFWLRSHAGPLLGAGAATGAALLAARWLRQRARA